MAPWARSTGENAYATAPRKPRPPARSGCVGVNRKSRRETCHRKRAQMNKRKYQRRSTNWKSGRLTTPSHQPAARWLQSSPGRDPIPARDVQSDLRAPDEPYADDVDKRDQHHLRGHRVAKAHARSDGRVKLRPRRVRDQPAFEKLPHHRAHSLMHDQFGQDHQRQRDQQAYVQFDVMEEGQPDAVAPGVPLDDRQQQQRYPCHQHHREHASVQQLKGVAGQARAPPELVQRPPEDQREVGGRCRRVHSPAAFTRPRLMACASSA